VNNILPPITIGFLVGDKIHHYPLKREIAVNGVVEDITNWGKFIIRNAHGGKSVRGERALYHGWRAGLVPRMEKGE